MMQRKEEKRRRKKMSPKGRRPTARKDLTRDQPTSRPATETHGFAGGGLFCFSSGSSKSNFFFFFGF
jgi:hypothetical protein